jgi:hypothetical protein
MLIPYKEKKLFVLATPGGDKHLQITAETINVRYRKKKKIPHWISGFVGAQFYVNRREFSAVTC